MLSSGRVFYYQMIYSGVFMKNFKNLILALLLPLILLFALTSCNDVIENGEKTVKIILGGEEYTLSTSADNLHLALIMLKEKENIDYEYEEFAFGIMIKKAGGVTPTDSEFIAIYHDLEKTEYIYFGNDTEYNGKTYHLSGVGAKDLPLVNGASYLIKTETF